MEEIEVWTVDGSQVSRLAKSNRMESELLLEDVLVENPGLLIEDLKLVGRQTPTEGGPLDLIGVDGEGRLVVFELKRGTLSRDAVAQVIDYASDLDGMELDDLANHISARSGDYGIDKIDDFQDWYTTVLGVEDLESLKPLRMFLVGLGVDAATERMVKFLAENSGMDISLLTFHGFEFGGKTILAKRLEVEGFDDSGTRPAGGYISRAIRRDVFRKRAEGLGVIDLVDDIHRMFIETSQAVFQGRHSVSETPGKTGISFSMAEKTDSGYLSYRSYFSVSLDSEPGIVQIRFFPRSIELCIDTFESLTQQGTFTKHTPTYATPTEQVQWDVVLRLSSQENWQTHKSKLTELAQTVYEAWENQGTEGESELSGYGNGGAT